MTNTSVLEATIIHKNWNLSDKYDHYQSSASSPDDVFQSVFKDAMTKCVKGSTEVQHTNRRNKSIGHCLEIIQNLFGNVMRCVVY